MSRKFKPGEKVFVLYDGRAKSGDTDRAAVLVSASSEAEARRDSRDFKGHDAIWYEYTIGADGKTVENETVRWDLKL